MIFSDLRQMRNPPGYTAPGVRCTCSCHHSDAVHFMACCRFKNESDVAVEEEIKADVLQWAKLQGFKLKDATSSETCD